MTLYELSIEYARSADLLWGRISALEREKKEERDEALSQIPFEAVRGRHLVVEEKCDGANSAISFGADGGLLLQSRGHYLTGGEREPSRCGVRGYLRIANGFIFTHLLPFIHDSR